MKLSSKSRYAIASLIEMAQAAPSQERVTVLSLSQRLDISKIFLEQVFSLLRRGGLVNSMKGAQGGYQLARSPEEISVYDILVETETGLFERSEPTVGDSAPGIEQAMRELLFQPLDEALSTALKKVLLSDLVEEAQRQPSDGGYMYYL
jgi:Rrf2 family protein